MEEGKEKKPPKIKGNEEIAQKVEESPSKELNAFVENLLKEMQDRFDEMSTSIIGRIDDMGKRIDEIEKSIGDLINEMGIDENMLKQAEKAKLDEKTS